MKRSFALLPAVVLSLFALLGLPPAPLAAQTPEPVGTVQVGEPLDPAHYGPSYVETLEQALAREQARGGVELLPPAYRDGRPGEWKIPSHGATYFPASGRRYATNRWGDTRMGIGFPSPVDVNGAHFAAQGGRGSWTAGVRVSGYLGGALVRTTAWFGDIGDQPKWLEMNLKNVDRIVVESKPVFRGAGWYALDDLTYTTRPQAAGQAAARVVIDFEDCGYSQTLSGTNYAGLTWETGTGEFDDDEQPPQALGPAGGDGAVAPRGGAGSSPALTQSFQGVIRGEAASSTYPPDTCGAVGPDHFVVVVNRVFAVYDKDTGSLLTMMNLGTFLPGSNGDPRVLYDQYSGRWIVIVTDFSNEIFLAVSTTSSATGGYFKTSFIVSAGVDASCSPDYPTLGVDANGIYTAAYMFGGGSCNNGMSLFAIEKAPLIAGSPSLGVVTAFRNLPYEQAVQPVHTYGTPDTPGEYVVSRESSSLIRVRRVTGPLTSPSMTTVASVTIPNHSSPADVPALSSATNLDSIDNRLMNGVYRDGSIWTCHNVGLGSRAGSRWYEITESPSLALSQSGTVEDPVISFWMPSIMVNDHGDAVMGFSGTSASQFVGAYYSGRLATTPLGQMSVPMLMKAGVASQNNIDQFGRNRWGDYSLCSLDPDDELTMWTIQEYAHATDIWGTWVGRLEADCDGDGTPDSGELSPNGPSTDCNTNFVPDECELDGFQTVFIEDFEGGLPAGWSASGLWHVTGACPRPSVCSGTSWAYYGQDGTCNFATGGTNSGVLTSTPISLPALAQSVTLTYCSSYAGQGGNSNTSGLDWAWLSVGGVEIDDVSLDMSNSDWEQRTVDLTAYAGQSISLDWNFDSRSSLLNVFLGWQVDRVEITAEIGGLLDCNGNIMPDSCDLASGASRDCDVDTVPDECGPLWANMGLFVSELLAEPQDPALVCVFDGQPDGLLDARDIGPFLPRILGP